MKYIYLNCIIVLSATTTIRAFSVSPQSQFTSSDSYITSSESHTICRHRVKTALSMGLFDGLKDAFGTPPTAASGERETPIDRWMGWNVKPMEEGVQKVAAADKNFVDAMDSSNYFTAGLTKPMGIVFEQNDDDYGGIFVISLTEGGIAEQDGTIKPGDQLIAVNDKKVTGLQFDPALGEIVKSEGDKTKLTLFRGNEEQLYGPMGASQDWLDEFIAKDVVKS